MNTDKVVRWIAYGAGALVVGYLVYSFSDIGTEADLAAAGSRDTAAKSNGPTAADTYLERVLDVSVRTIREVERELSSLPESEKSGDSPLVLLTVRLETAYNSAQPPIDTHPIVVFPQEDASLAVFADVNANRDYEQEVDRPLFSIEIDGQNSRVIASSYQTGVVDEYRSGGSGMFTGFLIGSMLGRQNAAGASAGVANKRPVSARQATQARARARAGSGGVRTGK
jgi:hypothetical protein